MRVRIKDLAPGWNGSEGIATPIEQTDIRGLASMGYTHKFVCDHGYRRALMPEHFEVIEPDPEPLPIAPTVYAYRHSTAGPCLLLGRVLSESAQFFTYHDDISRRPRRIKKSRVHTERCDCCSGGKYYPNGYDN